MRHHHFAPLSTHDNSRRSPVPAPAPDKEPLLRSLTPSAILQLQRRYGNQVVSQWLTRRASASPPIQRVVQVGRVVIDQSKFDAKKNTILGAIEILNMNKRRPPARKWSLETRNKIFRQIRVMVNSRTHFPVPPRKAYKSYAELVKAAKQLTAPAPVPSGRSQRPALPTRTVAPLGTGITPFNFTTLPTFATIIHDESSQHREDETGKSPSTYPEELRVPFTRRQQDKEGVIDDNAVTPYAFGSEDRELRSGARHFTTPVGGGKGPTYAGEWGTFATMAAIGGVSQQAAATEILKMLHGQTVTPAVGGNMSLVLLDGILGIIFFSEQSRATQSIICFAAAVNWVASGGGTFVEAFDGATAVFLGANDGGAQALRGNTPGTLLGQADRSAAALKVYLGNKIAATDDFNAKIKEIVAALLNNVINYKRARETRIATSNTPPSTSGSTSS